VEGYISDNEQVEVIRKWWRENGRSLILGLVIGIMGLAGYRYWDDSRSVRAESASINYEELLSLVNKKSFEDARKAGQVILDNYPDTTYARLAALSLTKVELADGKIEAAKSHLQWVLDHPGSDQLATLARARLAQLALGEGKADAAWALLEQGGLTRGEGFSELRADILAARGKVDEAAALYLKAQADIIASGGNPAVIELKLERLGRSNAGA
jgi:predicted negative regulator of RcsB-dependent stress response